MGVEVQLTRPLDIALSGIEHQKKRPLTAWQHLGVALKSNSLQNQEAECTFWCRFMACAT